MNSRGVLPESPTINRPEVRTGQAMLANRDTEVVICCAPVILPTRLALDVESCFVNSQVCVCQPHLPRIGRCGAQVLHLMKDPKLDDALNTDSTWMNYHVSAFQSSYDVLRSNQPLHDFLLANVCNSNYSGLLI